MRRISLIGIGVLLLFLGAIAPASAEQDQREQGSQAQKQEKAKPEEQQQAKPEEQKQAKPQAQQQKPQTQAKPARQEQRQQPRTQPEQAKSNNKQQEQQAQSSKQQEQRQAKSQQAQTQQNNQRQPAKNRQEQVGRQRQSVSSHPPQRTEEAQTRQRAVPALRLSSRGSGRIPDARFRSNFGRTHEFRIGSPRMVDGYSRFQYGGYWFGFVQPWPANWYYTDDVYVDYIDGQYYLCNPSYPGVNLAISVVM